MVDLFRHEEKPQPQEKHDAPHFRGDGVAVWVNKDKNGKPYLNIHLLNNSIKVVAFEYVPKAK